MTEPRNSTTNVSSIAKWYRIACYLTGEGRKQPSQLYPPVQQSVLEWQTTHFTLQLHQVEYITYHFEATYIPHSTCFNLFIYFSCDAAAQSGPWPPHSWGFLITHNGAPQSVGLLWTSDQFVAETSNWQHSQQTKHPCPRWDSNPQPQQASDRRPTLWPRGHWDRLKFELKLIITRNILSNSCQTWGNPKRA